MSEDKPEYGKSGKKKEAEEFVQEIMNRRGPKYDEEMEKQGSKVVGLQVLALLDAGQPLSVEAIVSKLEAIDPQSRDGYLVRWALERLHPFIES